MTARIGAQIGIQQTTVTSGRDTVIIAGQPSGEGDYFFSQIFESS